MQSGTFKDAVAQCVAARHTTTEGKVLKVLCHWILPSLVALSYPCVAAVANVDVPWGTRLVLTLKWWIIMMPPFVYFPFGIILLGNGLDRFHNDQRFCISCLGLGYISVFACTWIIGVIIWSAANEWVRVCTGVEITTRPTWLQIGVFVGYFAFAGTIAITLVMIIIGERKTKWFPPA